MTTKNRATARWARQISALPMILAGMFGVCAMQESSAQLTLNAAGIAAGFSLTTFYSDPNTLYGVLSLANGPGNTLIGAGFSRGELYKFNDVDGQTFGSQILTASAGGVPTGIAAAGGQIYVGLNNGGLYKVDAATLGLTGVTISPPIGGFAYGLWANPTNGHLIASIFGNGLIDIDPLTGNWVQIGPSGYFVDGVTVSPDGKTAYAAYTSGNPSTGTPAIVGYSLVSPNPAVPVFSTGPVGGGPDGTGVISGGLFDGDIIVNNNDGTLGLIDDVTGVETIIASGGTRGDLVSPDYSNGTLLLDQYEGVLRLSCGVGCSIGGPVITVPEPMTLALFATALVGIAFSRRRKPHPISM